MSKLLNNSHPENVNKIKKFLIGNLPIGVIIFFASFLRFYRINELLGFWYDQGRDALVIWDLIHKGKMFLIGPTTGIEGVFRGPWYYWLIAPFYWLGKGNPVFPAAFLIITAIAALVIIYYLGCKINGKATGLLAAIIASFSFYIVSASRWLSNPTPMLLLSVAILWAMFKVMDGKKWEWPIIAFSFGLSLFNFGSSAELFYFPVILIFIIWQRKKWPDLKNLILSIFLFSITFLPMVIFDFKHDGILRTNIYKSFISDKSFISPEKDFLVKRTAFYYDVFTRKIFDYRGFREKVILGITGIWFLFSLPKYFKNKKILLTMLMFFAPIAGLYFYHGNKETLYDYYFTGYYLIFILLLAVILGDIWKLLWGKIFIIYFLYLFLTTNFSILLPRLTSRYTGPESIVLSNQKEAVYWVYDSAGSRDFNIDVYVPPVIPYAYQYLFQWIGTEKYKHLPLTENVTLLYTLYEVDPDHPDRIKAWLDRQEKIGKVVKETRFGGITVQERQRISFK